MKSFLKYALSFIFGALVYSLLEIYVRGHTHWTMPVTAGTVMMFFMFINQSRGVDIVIRSAVGAAVITSLEFFVGSVVNLSLGWNVWDYSGFKFNIFGQICPRYSALWFLLSIPAFAVCDTIEKRVSLR